MCQVLDSLLDAAVCFTTLGVSCFTCCMPDCMRQFLNSESGVSTAASYLCSRAARFYKHQPLTVNVHIFIMALC